MQGAAWTSVQAALVEFWADAQPALRTARRGLVLGSIRAWPYAILLGLAVGGVLAVGVNLSNAFPSEARPFGWSGPSSFTNGVAMVRSELVLATVIPALALGWFSVRRLDPRREDIAFLGGIVAAGLVAVAAGVAVAGWWGAIAASRASWAVFGAFWSAHFLLAAASYSLTVFACVSLRTLGPAVATAVLAFYVAVYDNLMQWRLFREAGYHRLQAGDFPDWFLAGQAASPVAAYRGNLILGRREFMDGLERAVLADAVLPSWATAQTFAAALIALWIILPLGLAASVWKLRAWWAVQPRRRPWRHAADSSTLRDPT